MDSSGQFESEFTAFMECSECGWEIKADCWRDPELSPSYGFTCTECSAPNRFEVEPDPDEERDN